MIYPFAVFPPLKGLPLISLKQRPLTNGGPLTPNAGGEGQSASAPRPLEIAEYDRPRAERRGGFLIAKGLAGDGNGLRQPACPGSHTELQIAGLARGWVRRARSTARGRTIIIFFFLQLLACPGASFAFPPFPPDACVAGCARSAVPEFADTEKQSSYRGETVMA